MSTDKVGILIEIGKNVSYYRKQASMSQIEVANILDMNRSHISEIENGKANVTVMTLNRLAELFKVEIVIFFQISE